MLEPWFIAHQPIFAPQTDLEAIAGAKSYDTKALPLRQDPALGAGSLCTVVRDLTVKGGQPRLAALGV
jgi:hypothetical protein